MTMQTSRATQTNTEKISLANAMALLDSDYREILILICVKELKYEEVSELLQIPVAAVRIRLNRGREMLQDLMQMSTGVKRSPPTPPAVWREKPREGCHA
jgi:RNA polymerase sigma factor (sigma-70 family)